MIHMDTTKQANLLTSGKKDILEMVNSLLVVLRCLLESYQHVTLLFIKEGHHSLVPL